jgi:hypothetical protein
MALLGIGSHRRDRGPCAWCRSPPGCAQMGLSAAAITYPHGICTERSGRSGHGHVTTYALENRQFRVPWQTLLT